MLYPAETLAQMADFYAAHGVVHLPQLASADWVARLTSEIDRKAAGIDAPDAGSVVTYGRGEGRTTIRWLWRESAELRRFLLRAELGEVVAKVIRASEVRCWYDNTFIHDSGHPGGGTPWHHDIAVFPLKGHQNPSLWIALTPATRQSSTLKCIDGSHRDPLQYRSAVAPDDPQLPGFAPLPDVPKLIDSGDVNVLAWDVAPGDALLIHPYTLHGADGNIGASGRRVSFTTRWAGDDVVWRPDPFSMKVPGVDLESVPVGMPPRGEFFPRVWPA